MVRTTKVSGSTSISGRTLFSRMSAMPMPRVPNTTSVVFAQTQTARHNILLRSLADEKNTVLAASEPPNAPTIGRV